MKAQPGKKINSGIEPVDELMSGLDRGQLYLVHGEASGKSLFGIKFLIEGLKQGKNGALVISYSPEDAVRRFARLGYDCLEDVYSGRLVILEYSDDISQKIGKLRELTPLLRELEWLLGETQPERLIFDPVASVLAGAAGNIQSRASEFAEWARSFGATVVLIASESNPEIIESFQPLVAESFRFDVREVGERAARFLAFEKSIIPDQAIEVDPSRGVFLLGSSYSTEGGGQHRETPKPPTVAELETIKEELRAVRDLKKEEPVNTVQTDLKEVSVRSDFGSDNIDARPMSVEQDTRAHLETHRLTPMEEEAFQAPRISSFVQPAQVVELDLSTVEPAGTATSLTVRSEVPVDELSYLLDDLTGTASPLELDFPAMASPYKTPTESTIKAAVLHEDKGSVTEGGVFESETYSSGDDLKNDSEVRQPEASEPRDKEASLLNDPEMAARAAELLLRAPQVPLNAFLSAGVEHPLQVNDDSTAHESSNDLRPKDFNVLIIEDDAEMCDLLRETLGEYSLELVHDGVSGLARLIAFKPDLVILDFDLPIVDGFKVLTLIRTALNVPIIIVSGSRMRAIDRVMASELGADYYLTKPFSSKELRYKAKQLIARYRGINSWIVRRPTLGAAVSAGRRADDTAVASVTTAANEHDSFMPYAAFAAEVEKRVKSALTDGAQISIVGCRLGDMSSDGGRPALRLSEIVRELARDGDLISTNRLNDMVVLLDDAGSVGARAFVGRLRNRVLQELQQEPAIWMRSFPDVEGAARATAPVKGSETAVTRDRRSTDRANQPQDREKSLPSRNSDEGKKKTDPLDSYIDFLEQL
jgi:DNA-binding response OmpR family regulator/KaiC/GvpD/RAD55 family RecA-like ATPase